MPRDSFLLRLDPRVLAALRQWAEDDLRSLNGQIEFVLRQALQQAGRLTIESRPSQEGTNETDGK